MAINARLVASVEVWQADRSARVAVPNVTPTSYDIFGYIEDLPIRELLGDFGRAETSFVVRLIAGSEPVVASPVYLSRRRILRVIYDDASFEEYRIVKFGRALSGAQSATLTVEPIWRDLDKTLAKRTLTGGAVDYGWSFIGRTGQDVLDKIMEDAPSHFQAGTAAGALATAVVSIQARGSTHMALLLSLCAAIAERTGGGCEWDVSWNSGDSKYDIDLVTQIGGTLDHPVEFGEGSQNNRRELQKTEDAVTFFSRVVPLGGPDDELVTIAGATWNVSGASFSGGQTTLTLDGDPIYVTNMPGISGVQFGNATQGFFTVASTAVADTVVVTGDASALNGNDGGFRLSTGDDLTYLSDPSAESTAGQVERPERRSDIAPVTNILEENGISADLSSWSSGLPVGTAKSASLTVAQETDERYVQAGAISANCQGDADEYLETSTFTLTPGDSPYFSIWAAIRVLAGSVRIELLDGSGNSYPESEAIEGEGDTFRGIAAGGLRPPAGSGYKVRVTAREASTEFVIDSWTLVQSAAPYPYTPDMGPVALWNAGGALLAIEGGIQPDQLQGVWFDAAYLDGATEDEAQIGAKAQVLDAESGGVFAVDTEVRIVELVRQYAREAYQKQGRFGSRAVDVTSFLTAGRRRRVLPGSSPSPFPRSAVARMRVVVTDGEADVYLASYLPSHLHPATGYVYQDSVSGSPIATHPFTAAAEIGPVQYSALNDIALPDKESVKWYGILLDVNGQEWPAFTMADRDGIPGGDFALTDFLANPTIRVEYDDDTEEVEITTPTSSKKKTFSGLSGGGAVTYQRGVTTLDDASTEAALAEGEASGDYTVKVFGGGKTITLGVFPLHGLKQQFEVQYDEVIYETPSAGQARIDNATAYKDGSATSQVLQYKDGSSAWADAPTNPDDIDVSRPAIGSDPKEVLLAVKDGSAHRAVVSVTIQPKQDPRVLSAEHGTAPFDNGSNLVFSLNWSISGANTTDHELDIDYYADGVLVDQETAVAINASQPHANTVVGAGVSNPNDAQAVIRLREKSGGPVVHTLPTLVELVTT